MNFYNDAIFKCFCTDVINFRPAKPLPDPVADRFIRFCQQNGWKLSKAKRNKGGLDKLTDDEVKALEDVVGRAFEFDNIQAASDSSAAVIDWRPETGTEKG